VVTPGAGVVMKYGNASGRERLEVQRRIPMSIVIHGVVRGKTIELKESPGVPDGQEVEVVLRAIEPARRWGEGILRSAGAAADMPGFDEVFAEIQRERKASRFREPMS
jgi:hypothetical protein